MKILFTAFLATCLALGSARAEGSGSSKFSGGQIALIAGGAVIAVGGAAFFLVRHMVRDRKFGTSFTERIDSLLLSAEKEYDLGQYTSAAKFYEKSFAQWDEYHRYAKKLRRPVAISHDTLLSRKAHCTVLGPLEPHIAKITSDANALPGTEEMLVMSNRHEINGNLAKHRQHIAALEQENSGSQAIIQFGFRQSLAKFRLIDTMFKSVYDSEKRNFDLKCKFFYNRATETRDTSRLKNFVDDCDYYHTEKIWCEQARLVFRPGDTIPAVLKAIPQKQAPQISQIETEYLEAIAARRIDLLEAYYHKYSAKKYRKQETKINIVKTVLDSLRRELDSEVAYNKFYPSLANADLRGFQVVCKGLDSGTIEQYQRSIENLHEDLKKVAAVRFPAGIQIDYTANPPILLFNGYVNPGRDAQVSAAMDDGSISVQLTGVPGIAAFLRTLKSAVVESVLKSDVKPAPAQIARLSSAVYVIRLRKTATSYLTQYAHDNLAGGVDFYEFFDITADDNKNVRIKGSSSHVIAVLPKTDARANQLHQRLTASFFGL